MTRREGRVERMEYSVPPPPSRCAKILYYTWKLCSLLFSHLVMISLVVAYCFLGAVTFESLEAEHEREVKRNISAIRNHTTASIWAMTRSVPLLDHTNWTTDVAHMLKDFESSILLEMKVRGWDGNESTEHIQWTFTGALFYSIIVITTIGYGHIAPKTQTGKVVTIFYAILGIPLMLLCLSNIGDVMASSFRFLYWRVCCYLCTRPPKRRRRHISTRFLYWRVCCYLCTRPPKRRRRHISTRRSLRGRPGSTRRRNPVVRAHSDTDFRYRDSGYSNGRSRRSRLQPAPSGHSVRDKRTRSQPPAYVHDRDIEFEANRNSFREPIPNRDELHIENEQTDKHQFPKISLPLQDLGAALKDLENHHMKYKAELRSRSLPRPIRNSDRRYQDNPRNYVNRRSLNEERSLALEMHDLHDVDFENYREKKAIEEMDSRPTFRASNECDIFRDKGYDPEDEDFEFDVPNPRFRRTWDEGRRYRGQSEFFESSPGEQAPRRSRRAKSAMHEPRRWHDGGDRDRPWPGRWHDGADRDRAWPGQWRDGADRDRAWPEADEGKKRRLRRLQTFDTERQSPSPVPDDWSEEDVMTRRSRPPGLGYGPRHMEIVPVQPEPISRDEIKPVPIWLCVFLVAFYIVVGTFLFTGWEGWPYLDAAYFCFITLTTIGFGDFVPAQGATSGEKDAAAAVHSIALCSLYLLFGIALLAMSFNLVQEEVRANVAAVATSLGIIKPPRDDPDDDDTDY